MEALELILTKMLPVLAVLGTGAGWYFERRRRKAEAAKVEAEARGIDSEARVKLEGAEVSHVGTLLDKAEKLADKMLVLNTALMECERQKSVVDIRVAELEAEKRHIEDTLKAEVNKVAAKEAEIVRLTELKHLLEDRVNQ